MQSVSQMIKKQAHQLVRNRIRENVQPGTLQAIFAQELHAIIGDALNVQLSAERDQALGRCAYERKPGPARNGCSRGLFFSAAFLVKRYLRQP